MAKISNRLADLHGAELDAAVAKSLEKRCNPDRLSHLEIAGQMLLGTLLPWRLRQKWEEVVHKLSPIVIAAAIFAAVQRSHSAMDDILKRL